MANRIPPPTADDAYTAADAIYARRARHRDNHPTRTDLVHAVEAWPGDEDLLAVVDFVRAYQALPAGILGDDALDQLAIVGHLEREILRRRHYAIRLARRAGVTWTRIAGALGVRSPQAAEQCALRLADLFEGVDGTRDDTAARTRRRHQPPSNRPAPTYPGLRAALADLLAHRRELPAAVDEVLGYFRLETTRLADMTDGQLARGLRAFLIHDLAGVTLSSVAGAAADRLAVIVGPGTGTTAKP